MEEHRHDCVSVIDLEYRMNTTGRVDTRTPAEVKGWQHLMPRSAEDRKALPLFSGVMNYFPLALLAVAQVSKVGNDQHNPNQPLHWAREKSTDQLDTAARHLLEHGTRDTDGMRHTAKAAWRILAELQLEIERDGVI
jgi:hypothetical protein